VSDDVVALDQALSHWPSPIREPLSLVNLHYFAELTIPQAADFLGVSPRTADFL
jgi:hypothetical protein